MAPAYLLALFVALFSPAPVASLVDGYPDFNIAEHLGTKSPYPVPVTPLVDRSVGSGTNCTVSSLYHLNRHGSRYPTASDISRFTSLATTLARTLPEHGVDPRFQFLRNWTNPFDPLRPSFLAPQGERDLFGIGERFRQNYASFLAKQVGGYDPLTYDIRSTQLSRTGISASAFVAGLFLNKGSLRVPEADASLQPAYIYTFPTNGDYLLRGYENCPAYESQVAEIGLPTALRETDVYADKTLASVLDNLASKTGGRIWTRQEAEVAFKVCAFEVSLFQRYDGFCTLLEEEDILKLEYIVDMDDYYDIGYGVPLSGHVACPILSEVLSSSSGAGNTLVKIRVAHDQTVTTLSVLLGLHRDKFALKGSTAASKIASRQFRMSKVAPFAANVIFETLECPSSSMRFAASPRQWKPSRTEFGTAAATTTRVIRVRKNEQDVFVPSCPKDAQVVLLDGTSACIADAWRDKFECRFDEVCYP